MAQASRIPTPLKQHWYRFRIGMLPVLSFVACVVLMLWLWQRQAYHGSFVGEVAATSVDVKADIAGQLTFPADQYWQLYDPIQEGTVIARLDDRPTLARLATVQATVKQLEAELAAAETDLLNRQIALNQQQASDKLRLQLEVDRRWIDVLQLAADVKVDEVDVAGLKANLDILEGIGGLRQVGYITGGTVSDLKRQVQVLETRIARNKTVGTELKKQHEIANERLHQFADLKLPAVNTVLDPIHADIAVQESLMNEINLELNNLSIKAPITGIISAIYHRPGQRIVAGDRILTISMADSQYIVSYVREHQQHDLHAGMAVGLKLRQPGSPEFTSQIAEVGPQVERVPAHQLKDQAAAEWATPIKIPIPADLRRENVRPGQLLNVIIREPRRAFWSADRAR